MKYALKLAEDGRILFATFAKYAQHDAVEVDELPEGNLHDFRLVAGEYIHDPILPDPVEVARERIDELKKMLADTDYNILKIVEGAATLTEMAETIKKRASWRKEINDLEVQYELFKK